MGEFTFVVEKTCPICGEKSREVKVKARLLSTGADPDFCTRYKGINPYFYKIWICEHCGFATDEKHFVGEIPIAERKKNMLREYLYKNQEPVEFKEERTMAEAVASYQKALFFAEMIDERQTTRAGYYLSLAWIYRIAEDRENEDVHLKKALELYEKAYMTEKFPIGALTDTAVVYLIGALYGRLGMMDKFGQYMSRLIHNEAMKAKDPRTVERARRLWTDMREDQKMGKIGW